MSKIYGYISNYNVEEKSWLAMIQSINKREKNINQFWMKNVAFANLNDKCDEIKYLITEKKMITFDGEIENKEELYKILNIHPSSEVELIEQLYKKYGEEFVHKIEGFFAIAIYDREEEKLILVRDKIGVKPIYYFIGEDNICFASELNVIMKYPYFQKKINYNALSMYFRYSYINPPNTIFENTYKLEHGHYLVWKKREVQNKIYWDGIEKFNILSQDEIKNFDDAKTNIKTILYQNLKKTLESSDAVGIYLSGGIDSSLVASISQEISVKPINTFSIGFYENERNEAEKAKRIAEYLGTNHHELYIDKDTILSVIHKIPEYYDEPFADASEIPTIILNEFASKNGIKVAITGDGADQLFCGSSIYDKEVLMQNMYRIFNSLGINLKFVHNTNITILKQLYGNSDKRNQTQIDIIAKEKQLNGLLLKDEGEKRYNFENRINSKSWQVKRLMVDANTFLANRLNTKADRASSKNNIVIKSPFLVNELIEYSFRLPHKFKYFNKKNKKYILKQILNEYISDELLSNKKHGFGIPIRKWLNTYLHDDLMKVSKKEFILKQKIFNYDKLNELIEKMKQENSSKNIEQIIWNFYIFQLWYMKYI